MSKGSAPRPADDAKLAEGWEKIVWTKPHGCDGSCGYPFCDCDAVCVETVKEPSDEPTA